LLKIEKGDQQNTPKMLKSFIGQRFEGDQQIPDILASAIAVFLGTIIKRPVLKHRD
jgi:hypothetical protein